MSASPLLDVVQLKVPLLHFGTLHDGTRASEEGMELLPRQMEKMEKKVTGLRISSCPVRGCGS